MQSYYSKFNYGRMLLLVIVFGVIAFASFFVMYGLSEGSEPHGLLYIIAAIAAAVFYYLPILFRALGVELELWSFILSIAAGIIIDVILIEILIISYRIYRSKKLFHRTDPLS